MNLCRHQTNVLWGAPACDHCGEGAYQKYVLRVLVQSRPIGNAQTERSLVAVAIDKSPKMRQKTEDLVNGIKKSFV